MSGGRRDISFLKSRFRVGVFFLACLVVFSHNLLARSKSGRNSAKALPRRVPTAASWLRSEISTRDISRHEAGAQSSSEDPGSTPGDTESSATTAAIVDSYRGLRRNIFFDSHRFVADSLDVDGSLVPHLFEWLRAPPASDDEDALLEPSRAVVLQRMAAIDLLQNVVAAQVTAESARAAREGLNALATMPVPQNLPNAQRKIIAGERYDTFVALARLAPDAALRALRRVEADGGPRKFFLRAVQAGLVDAGVRREALAEMTRRDR